MQQVISYQTPTLNMTKSLEDKNVHLHLVGSVNGRGSALSPLCVIPSRSAPVLLRCLLGVVSNSAFHPNPLASRVIFAFIAWSAIV